MVCALRLCAALLSGLRGASDLVLVSGARVRIWDMRYDMDGTGHRVMKVDYWV